MNPSADKKDTASGKTPFIDKSTAFQAYDESKKWLRPYFEPIDEFERIARNRPKENIPDGLPKLTEGTTSAINQENPRRVIQQLATGQVKYSNNPALAAVADIVHRRILLPNYEMNGTALQKSWNMQTKSNTWGMSNSYTFFTYSNGRFHTDYSIPYIKDTGIEKGKVYAGDSNVRWMRSWYSRNDLKRIIQREQMMQKERKGYTSDWDLTALADFMESSGTTKPGELRTPAEREKGSDSSGGYEVIHIFQNGKGAELYSFSPQYKNGQVLRTKVNSDPRGKMPLDSEYCNIDLSNPLGRGMVELAGPIQNLMDQKLQQHSYMSTLMISPPLQVWGNVNKSTLKFGPGRIWDMGNNANNMVKPYEGNTAAIQSFVSDMQFLQSKIYNLFASQDNSIPSEDNNTGQSKTSAGVKEQAARVGVADNYFLKQHEAWFEAQAETSINLFFAEMKGTGELQLDGDDLRDIQSGPAAQFVDENGVLHIPYDDINKIPFTFEVDPSSSEVKEDQDNASKLIETLNIAQNIPNPEIQSKIPGIFKLIVKEIGAEGTDKLFPEQRDAQGNVIEEQPQENPNALLQQVMPQVQQMVEQMFAEQKQQPKSISESIKWSPADLSPSERAQALEQGGIQPDNEGITPNEMDMAHQQSMDIQNQTHQQAMDIHKTAQSDAQSEEQNAINQQQFQQTQEANREQQLLAARNKQGGGSQ